MSDGLPYFFVRLWCVHCRGFTDVEVGPGMDEDMRGGHVCPACGWQAGNHENHRFVIGEGILIVVDEREEL